MVRWRAKTLHLTPNEKPDNKRRDLMLWTIIVILVVLWLLGFLGSNVSPRFPKTGSWIHALIVIAVILLILQLLGVVNL
jgi:lipopolysaccharide export LptBFGC system permease protein LptF